MDFHPMFFRQMYFCVHEEMICLETQHFRVNRILLLGVGLWPYQRSPIVKLQFILLLGVLISFIIFQFTTFLTSKCTIEHIIKVFSITCFFMCNVIEYSSFWFNADIVRCMLEQFQDVCNNLRDEKEIAIIEKYGSKAKCYTTVFILLGILNKCNLAVVQILPYIQHIVLPKNESRLNPSVYVATEYFTDREKYFYLTTLHTLAASYVGNALMIATGAMLIAYIQHICGMFSIARNEIIYSYRIEQAMNILQKDILKSENKVYKEIAYAVDIHRKAMEFADILISNFGGPYFFMIMFGLIGVSLSLYRAASHSDNIEQLFFTLLMIKTFNAYLFLGNYFAQEITDHNEYVFVTVYNVPWYVSPLHIQRIILFLLQRGIKAFQIIIGGIFVANMESAAAIRSSLDRLQDVCNEIRDDNEIAILKKYGSKAKRYTTAMILLGIYCIGTTTAMYIWPYIQYIGLPKNESRLNPSVYFMTEYFIDQEKYSYLITLNVLAAIYIGAVSLIATGTMLIAYIQHICGMFSIASYRIEQAINILQKDILKSENMVYKKITYAVDIHCKAMEFTDFLISNFEGSFFLIMVIGVTCSSFNLFWLASYSDEIEKLVVPFIIINILYTYLFLANYIAQEITDHNKYVFATVYNVQWYTAPLHIQKIILFLLQRGTKPFHINLGGIFVASLESAATLHQEAKTP
ncbi:uncharacterized protein [Temnothorax longispinosus]|uniref:uncharacterized protein isoform X4 n=1 Tax=Temnothorax longispinosus TaxID=300112 RepID=UPI003A99C3E2